MKTTKFEIGQRVLVNLDYLGENSGDYEANIVELIGADKVRVLNDAVDYWIENISDLTLIQ